MLGEIGVLLLAYILIVFFSILSEITYKKRPAKEVLKKEELLKITKKASLGFLALVVATVAYGFFTKQS